MKLDFIFPDWPAPANVQALQTTRQGGYGAKPFDSLNLGNHVGDNPLLVEKNRQCLAELLPSEPIWLEQVHGTHVIQAEHATCHPTADACVARTANAVCVVMTADCLPVLLCDQAGTVVAAAHAGWRGLAAGVIEATVNAMNTAPEQLMAWLGPAIGPSAFEMGKEVRDVFMRHSPATTTAFTPHNEKYLADIYSLARQRLSALGVRQVYGGQFCTFSDPRRFFSYRRDGQTGRMATMIWLKGGLA
jgi:hypothetical protein